MGTGVKKTRLGELDALRGFAALSVVIFHLSMPCIKPTLPFRFFLTGVDLFFMISGFVITMSISHVKKGREFVVNRFARLYPVYWACLILSFIVRVVDVHVIHHQPILASLWVQFGANFTMVQYYFNIANFEDPYWTLIIELLFYVLVYIIYKLKKLNRIEPILFSIVLIQLALLLLSYAAPGNEFIKNIIAGEHYFPLAHYLPLFLSGVIFYNIYTSKSSLFRYLALMVCYAMQILEYDFQTNLALFAISKVQFAIILAVFMVVFVLFINNWLRFIVNSATLFLGRISYALYLFHQYLSLSVLLPFFQDRLHLPYLFSCCLCLVVVIATAGLVTLFIDEPVRFRIRGWLK